MAAKKRGRTSTRSAPVPRDLLLAAGVKAQRTGDVAAAERNYRKVLASNPRDVEAVQFLGAILAERGDIDEALDLFDPVAEKLGDPTEDTFGFFNNYANTLRRAKRFGTAEKILRQLTTIAPREWQAWHNLGQTLKDLERNNEAAAALRRAILLAPDYGPNHGLLGEVLHNLGRLHSAQASLRRCIELGWDKEHGVWTVLASTERMLGNLESALELCTKALALSGGVAAAHSNMGVICTNLGRFDDAVKHLRRALELWPDNKIFHGYLAFALFADGRIEEGIEHWELGIRSGPRGRERKLGVPRWTPEDPGTRVLVYREQGVGDEIMFASIYPDVIEAAGDVVIECDPRLQPLLARSFPTAEVRGQTYRSYGEETMHDFDRAIPAGSLMKHFRRTVEDYPARESYLVADPERVAAWRERLAEIGPGPYVGISWRSKVQTAERRLEYTRLEEWESVFAVPGVTWVNLQYDDCERELHDAEQRFGVTIHRWEWLDLLNDFDEVAALCCALDLVVAPFNAVAMLGGALGVRTVAMGNRFSWNEFSTGRMVWFTSLRAVFRTLPEEWDEVLNTAAQEVAEVAAAHSHV